MEDTLYATAVVLTHQVGNQTKNTLLLNIYRSPNGRRLIRDDLQHYVDFCHNYCQKLPTPIPIHGEIIGGDFNASHLLWGAQRHTAESQRMGNDLLDFIHDGEYHILNNGQPTRIKIDHLLQTETLSWIDVTLCRGLPKEHAKWHVLELDNESDHFQIHMQLLNCKTTYDDTDEGADETRWHLTDKKEKWDQFATQLDYEWQIIADEVRQLQRNSSPTEASDRLAQQIKNIFHQAASKVFGSGFSQKIWRRWVSSEMQGIAISYHKFYRRFRAKRRKKAEDYRKLQAMRAHRNRVFRNHKRQWIEKKFSTQNLAGREGWQIAAEVRDLNEERGRTLPDLHDKDTRVVVASTLKEKLAHLNEHYHRFDHLQTGPVTWCWNPNDIIPSNWSYPSTAYDERRRDDDPQQPEDLNAWKPKLHGDPHTAVLNPSETHHRFAAMIRHKTHQRWRTAQSDHGHYLTMLNRPISKMELRRALSSFKTHKSAGPDRIEISFLKKGGSAAIDILETVCNLFYQTWHCIPTLFKQRWITPIIKPGKAGDIAKDLRPISLTSYIAKVWEKLMVYRLVTYLVRLRLLSRLHFAYISCRSTTDAIVYLVNRLEQNLNRCKTAHGVFFDMSSAFDTVRIPLLLWKLEHEYFITGPFLETLRDFLSGRYGAVKINGILSAWRQDVIGVPQGGGLSPILFLIYIDLLATVDGIQGIRMSIFADDLCIFDAHTSNVDTYTALQEGILFVQWYCYYHGLLLNHDKTKYKVFTKSNNYTPLPLKLSGSLPTFLQNNEDQTAIRTATDTPIPDEPEAVRYLGVHLDRKLNFNAHADIVLEKAQKVYYMISRNLRKLWHIKADIIWRLLDACIFSIFDYSAVIWLQMSGAAKTKWKSEYKKILHRAYNVTTGTGLIHQYLQCHTMDLDTRLCSKASQYCSRMIRAPKSSALYREIYLHWWPAIRKFSQRHPGDPRSPPSTDNHYMSYVRDDGSNIVAKDLPHTLIWDILQEANCHGNDDLKYCSQVRKYQDLPHEISYLMDLTNPWTHHCYEDAPFTDEWSQKQQQETSHNDLLMFTDGSVKGRVGGFGVHIIPQNDYHRMIDDQLTTTSGYKNAISQIPNTLNYHSGVSRRCSIDFCEALAIRKGLQMVQQYLRTQAINQETWTGPKALNICQRLNIQAIRIVSDSQVVLRWIEGIYRIHNLSMKGIVEDIHWLIEDIQAENSDIPVILQWTKSHNENEAGNITEGNCHADHLADKGRQLIEDNEFDTKDYWSFYNLRAALKNDLKEYTAKMQNELTKAIQGTKYGTIMSRKVTRDEIHKTDGIHDWTVPHSGYRWNKYHYKELSSFSRDEIRILIALRTGHDHLRHYMSKMHKHIDPRCSCGGHPHELQSILRNCTLPTTVKYRNELVHAVGEALQQEALIRSSAGQQQSAPLPAAVFDYYDPLEYLYPKGVSAQTACILKRLIIRFYRQLVGYRTRW